jgi:hypothetical protein
MDRPARNALCPCGSGRKYKRCCYRKDVADGTAYTAQDKERALARLLRFAEDQKLAASTDSVTDLFWGGRLEKVDPSVADELRSDETSFFAFLAWLLFDHALEGDGATIADRFLTRPGVLLTSGERTYVERMRRGSLRLYEIEEVRVDEGITLRDLWNDATIAVTERLGTRQLVQWDLVAARVIEGGTGATIMDGVPYPYPASARAELVRNLKREHRRFSRNHAPGDDARFFKSIGHLFHHWWLDLNALRPMPKIVTADGDDLVFVKSIFDVADRAQIEQALAADAAFVLEEDGYVWLEGAGASNRVLGRLALTERRLTLETQSRERAARGRALLEALLPGGLRHRASSEQSLESALADRRTGPRRTSRPAEDELTPELQQEIVGAMYERHYRAWMDEPVPALGGRTPRHAARLKTVLPVVVDLVKGIENQMDHARRNGEPWIDVSWLRSELGLPRPDLGG